MRHRVPIRAWSITVSLSLLCLFGAGAPAAAAERLCDPSFENCRAPLLALIQNERAGIDVAFTFMEDDILADALIARFRAGVPVRALVDPRRNAATPYNAVILQKLAAAGIPMRQKVTSGQLHWKFMLFVGQQSVQFSAANYSDYYFIPVQPYVNYTDEGIYFCDDSPIVDSFKTRMDDAWTDITLFRDYANITAPPARRYPTFPIDPALNFVPWQNFSTRAVPRYDAETSKIDVMMYKITEATHADGMIRAAKRGIPVRLITEPDRYRNKSNIWQAYHVDRLYAAGVKIRDRAHQGFLHQKNVLLYGQALTIFGSSNWTSESNKTQHEHNYFTVKGWIFGWFRDNFERKWTNRTGNIETKAFVPLPPDKPVYVAPANLATGQPLTPVYLTWKPGSWAHRADIYFGTTADPPLFKSNVSVSPGSTKKYLLPTLTAGQTYYWKIVSRTMAGKTATGAVWSFSTSP